MNICKSLVDIEFLVFSSHKSATQTIINSLKSSRVKSRHCHLLKNIGLEPGQFCTYLDKYHAINLRKLEIISVFRDPLERMISSFYQSVSAWIKNGVVYIPEGENIFSKPHEELQEMFIEYCSNTDGWGESISLICQELSISTKDLHFSYHEMLGSNELESCRLHLLRFDQALPHMSLLLSRIADRNIVAIPSNISTDKTYYESYTAFRRNLRIPDDMIKALYASRRDMIDLFYPGQYEDILETKMTCHGALARK